MSKGGSNPLSVKADGGIHRFHVADDRSGSRNGWYLLHADEPMAGAFGSWRTDEKHTWCERAAHTLSEAERTEFTRRIEEAKAQRDRVRQETQQKAQERANEIWSQCTPAQVDHRYLASKGVRPHGIRLDGDRMVIPLRDSDGTVHTLQFITGGGEKRFLPDGAVESHYHSIGRLGEVVYIAEGYGTAATIHEVMGEAVAVGFNSGNLLPVAKALRAKYPGVAIVVAADNDQWRDGNPGLTKATEAAEAANAKLAVPSFKDTASKPTDFNDLARLEGLETVRHQLERFGDADSSEAESGQLANRIAELAALPTLEYERERQKVAKELDVRVTVLDAEVEKTRAPDREKRGQGSNLELLEPECWPEPVDGGTLLAEVTDVFTRYVVLLDHADVVLALWVAHCHVFDVFMHTPRLNITSPQKQCGKTLLIDVIGTLVPRPLTTENVSLAAFFRVVEQHSPVLLCDEYDSYIKTSDDLSAAR